ncbi:chemotaxis protein CheB [Gemmatimonadetes bacterium T265]|nr:chemotaxis protein CheB [Gemmatimonadetes bacterium T265]
MEAKRDARPFENDEVVDAPDPTPAPPATSVRRDIVVIGASAGGVEALKVVLGTLPPDYNGTVCVVLHIPPSVPSVLAHILGRSTRLVCVSAYDGAPVRPGVVYVAPPDHHLLLEDDRVRLLRGPRENGHRPAIDPLFRSAAAAYGPRVVGVVLTGNLDDGTRGLFAIKHRGGLAVVQDPEDALYPSMPRNAIENVDVDWVLPAPEVGPLLAALATDTPWPARSAPPADALALDAVTEVAAVDPDEHQLAENGTTAAAAGAGPNGGAARAAPAELCDDTPLHHAADLATGIGHVDGGARINERLGGTVSGYTCPECHGSLWELEEGKLVRYRCRVGHSYTEPGLVDHKAHSVEDAIWTALTALEESAAIAARVADRSGRQGRSQSATYFRARAAHLERRGAVLRDLLAELPGHVDAA